MCAGMPKKFVQSRSRDVLWSGNTGTDQRTELPTNCQTRGRLAVVSLFRLSDDYSTTTLTSTLYRKSCAEFQA